MIFRQDTLILMALAVATTQAFVVPQSRAFTFVLPKENAPLTHLFMSDNSDAPDEEGLNLAAEFAKMAGERNIQLDADDLSEEEEEDEDDEDLYDHESSDDNEEDEECEYLLDHRSEVDLDQIVESREPPEEEEQQQEPQLELELEIEVPSAQEIVADLQSSRPLMRSSRRNTRREYPWTKSLPANRPSPPRKQWRSQRDETDTSKDNALTKKVTFSTVQVREYSITVGNHPLCRDNMPLTLDWSYITKPVESVFYSPQADFFGHFDILDEPSYRPRKLSYAERKQRLVEVTAMTESQLLELYFELKLSDQEQERKNELDQFSTSILPEDEDEFEEIIFNTNSIQNSDRSKSTIDNAKIMGDSFDDDQEDVSTRQTTDKIVNQLTQFSAWFEYQGGQDCPKLVATTVS
mmetsp:Transcript_8579/g.13155  ORF Transcript_8579/g.13155 Transcript_8579/m.13155 type:complete len:408 (-) Transcript_8579:125-1348(-)